MLNCSSISDAFENNKKITSTLQNEEQETNKRQKQQLDEHTTYHKLPAKMLLSQTALGQKIKEKNDRISSIDTLWDINIKDSNGDTLLHLAIEKNNIHAVEQLLKKNVNINAQNKRNQTALHYAVDYKHIDIINLLLEHAAEQHQLNYLQNFLEIKDHDGATALLHAVQQNQTCITKLLIKFGANIFTTNNHEHSLLHFIQDPVLAQDLILSGLNVDYQGRFNNTPLHFAVNQEVAQVLIENKANIHALSDEGNTPLHTAKTTAIARALLAAGADVNYKNYKSNPPLYFAIKNLNTARCHLLLEHGADENMVDTDVLEEYNIHSHSYLPDNFIQEMRATNKLEHFFTDICPAFSYTYQEDIEYQYLRNLSLQCILTKHPMNIKDLERFNQLNQLLSLESFKYLESIDKRLLETSKQITDKKIRFNLNTINTYIAQQLEHHLKIDPYITCKNKSAIAVNALSQIIAHNLTTK